MCDKVIGGSEHSVDLLQTEEVIMEQRAEAEDVTPEAVLANIENAHRRTREAVTVPSYPILGMWGVGWLVAFTVTFFATQAGQPLAFLGSVGVTAVWLACIGTAVTGQAMLIARKMRGIDVGAQRQRVYQMTTMAWILAMVLAGTMAAITEAPAGGAAMFFVFAVALLYLAFGAVDDDRAMFGMGAWLGVLNVAAGIVAPDSYAIVMALLGGGAFIAVSAVLWHQDRISPQERVAKHV